MGNQTNNGAGPLKETFNAAHNIRGCRRRGRHKILAARFRYDEVEQLALKAAREKLTISEFIRRRCLDTESDCLAVEDSLLAARRPGLAAKVRGAGFVLGAVSRSLEEG